jgi:PAS domain S-box-containing protein
MGKDNCFMVFDGVIENSSFSKETSQEEGKIEKAKINNLCKAFAESVSAAMLFFNEEGEIKYANNASENIFGYAPSEFIGQKLARLIPDVTKVFRVEDVQAYWTKAQKTERPGSIEVTGIRKSGEAVALEVLRGRYHYNDERFFTLLVRDISERKKRKAEIIESRQRLEALLDSIKGVAWECDSHPGKLTYISPQVERLLGFPVEHWYKRGFGRTIIHPEDRERVVENCRAAVANQSNYEVEFRVIAADGRILWLRDTATITKDEDRLKMRGLMLDVTKRAQAEHELRASKELYRDLVENANDIIYSHDLEGRITSLNTSGARLMGYTLEEALTMNVFDVVAPASKDKAIDSLVQKLSGEEKTIYELELITKHGHHATVEVNTRLAYEDGKPVGVQGIARDVTERNHLQSQLYQAQKMETVGRLAGGIAHDFNNLLTVILGKAGLALLQLKDSESQLRRDLEDIKGVTERAASLTQQILAFSRKQVLQPRVIDLNNVVSDMGKILNRLIGEDVRLETILRSDIGNVKADPTQIEQVIMNLAVNARDAMPKGGKLIIETSNARLDENYSRHHANAKPGQYVMIAVSDNGCGMSEEVLNRAFEPFFTTKEQDIGTGLGLSTVYGIVKQSDGYIWVYSEEGVGTTFKIYLPRIEDEAESVLPSPTPEEFLNGHETILLVEDDDLIRSLVKEMLDLMGYKVVEASDGATALETIKELKEPIDLLLTDIVMPGMSGCQIAEHLCEAQEQAKILYMTGYTDEAIVRHGLLDSGLSMIQKPFTLETLVFKVRELLDDKESH